MKQKSEWDKFYEVVLNKGVNSIPAFLSRKTPAQLLAMKVDAEKALNEFKNREEYSISDYEIEYPMSKALLSKLKEKEFEKLTQEIENKGVEQIPGILSKKTPAQLLAMEADAKKVLESFKGIDAYTINPLLVEHSASEALLSEVNKRTITSSEDKTEKPKKYLILTSSGGGGHVNAANTRKAELLKLGIPEDQIAIVDLMGKAGVSVNQGKAWVPTYSVLDLDPFFSGEANTKKWDDAQKEGTEEAVRNLEGLVEMQPLAEAMQADSVKRNLLAYLKDNDVQEIYNTQALSTPAICQAIVEYNEEEKVRPLEILTTVTDLITHRAEHFLSSLKNLTDEQANVLKMEIAAKPMCDPGEEEKDFYKRYDIPPALFVPKSDLERRKEAVDDNKIIERVRKKPTEAGKYTLPVTPVHSKKREDENFVIKAYDKFKKDGNEVELNEEQDLKNRLGEVSFKVDEKSHEITIDKKPEDKMIFITMGSQGSNTVLEYMDEFAHQLESTPKDGKGNIYLCVAAGRGGEGSLHGRVKERADDIMSGLDEDLKKRVKILPLGFQGAEHMSSLLKKSDIVITRSGGMSAMEAKATQEFAGNRQVYVHSEAKLEFPEQFPRHSYDATYEALMPGTVKWEGGNAEWLLREAGASLGSPETINFGLDSAKAGNLNAKEESLFHFAYDEKLNKGNLVTIERLIREGSSPNLRFAGGSYLLDHCKDIETKSLLVKYGAKITSKSLDGLSADDKKELKRLEANFKKYGMPEFPSNYYLSTAKPDDREYIESKELENKTNKTIDKEENIDSKKPDRADKPIISDEREKLAAQYRNPYQPKNIFEKLIVGMDKVGNFISSKILRSDAMHNALDSTRMYLKTDPTEERGFVKSLKQLRSFAFDVTVFIAKQPVHMVVKPIAFAANIVKAGLMGAGMLINEAKGEDSNICNSKQFKANAKQALGNLGESLVAWGTAALVVSGFGAPIAVSLFGANMSISLGAAKFGAAQPIASALNAGLGKAVAAIGTEAGTAVIHTQGALDIASRAWHFSALNPKKLFHKEEGGLNSLGEKVQKLHQESSNLEIDIEVRRQAQKEVDKIMKLQKIDKMAAPVLKKVTSAFRNRGH